MKNFLLAIATVASTAFVAAQCPAPTDMEVIEVDAYAVAINGDMHGADYVEFAAGVPGFTPVNATHGMTNIQWLPYSRASLHANTTYEFYVRSVCGGSTSEWVGPISVTTLPASAALSCKFPTLIDFDILTPYRVNIFSTIPQGGTIRDFAAGNPGFTPSQPNFGMNNITASPYLRTSLHAGRTYDFYIRQDCSGDNTNVSPWIGPFTITMPTADQAQRGVSVYPNPVRGELTLEGVNAASVTVYGVDGSARPVNVSNNKVNLDAFAPGNYILQVADVDGNVSTVNVMKK
ncbi:MAG: T9SS type A sorting domain-containing protein [Weeksellaceae bacterium]|nr:T9SS type A sorting domain-containing protein [Weeksellaceae bacterium]